MRSDPALHQHAFFAQVSCLWEATARKVGNVHPGADFADTSYPDFLVSAAAVGMAFAVDDKSLGVRVRRAVERTRRAVGKNTNLGIVLLLAPLAAPQGVGTLRDWTAGKLQGLDAEDTRQTFAAIRLANPGGLGDAPEQDVRDEPTVTLLEAMRLAADRDQIARQYATGYADVFDLGVPAFLDGFERFGCVEAAVVHCQLAWLSNFPDSLIARKCGPAIAAEVRDRAAAVVAAGGLATPDGRAAGVALDKHLRSNGNRLNPGTTADLVTACLFVALREGRVRPNAPFRWDAPDWLPGS
jgi:triphosphoribosyl-dephospho-CoA synthase